MVWVILLSAVTIFLAVSPYVVYLRMRLNAASGRVPYEELSAATGTYQRGELESRFGPPDEDNTYTVSADFAERAPWESQTESFRPKVKWVCWLFAHAVAYATLIGACLALGLCAFDEDTALALAGFCAGVQVLRWGIIAGVMVRTYGWDICGATENE